MVVRELVNKIGFRVDDAALKRAEARIRKVAEGMQRIGTRMTAMITLPLIGLGVASVRAFSLQNQALAQMQTGLKTTGNQVGITFDNLRKSATRLQKETLFGDETILQGVTNQLLTFTNIVGENFERTQQAVLDVTSRLYGAQAGSESLRSTAIQLGKALNDPVANLGALSRSGIQFSVQQKEVIKSLAESGRLADAQSIILVELQKQYGGSAKAAAEASIGFKQMRNDLGDLMESFGEILQKAFKPFIKWIRGLIQRFRDSSVDTKKFILILMGVTAVIPPLIALIGALTLAVLKFNASVLLIPLAIAAIIFAIGLLIDDFFVWKAGGDSVIGDLLGSFGNFREKLKSIFGDLVSSIMVIWGDLKTRMQGTVFAFILTWYGFIQAIIGLLTGNTDLFIEGIKNWIVGAAKTIWNLLWVLEDVLHLFSILFWKALHVINDAFNQLLIDLWTIVKEGAAKIWEYLDPMAYLKNKWIAFKEFVENLIEGLKNKFPKFFAVYEKIKGFAGKAAEVVSTMTGGGMGMGGVPALAGARGFGSTNTNSNQNINNGNFNAYVTVPPGTPEEQVQSIKSEVEKIYDDYSENMFKHVMSDNPVAE